VARGSFFSLFTKPFFIILKLIEMWAVQMNIARAVDLCKVRKIDCKRMVTLTLFQRLRNVCSYLIRSNHDDRFGKLGGRGKVVEIDEILVAKIKYHRGSGLGRKQIWLFGLVERGEGGRCYLTMVPNRKAETLLRVIFDHVKPHTTIVSDSWSSYNKLTHLNYRHLTVNHSVNFLDPETGAHTNKIEGLWAQVKRKFKEMNGCSRVHLQSYIDEFMWRQNNGLDRETSYAAILAAIATVYPPGQAGIVLDFVRFSKNLVFEKFNVSRLIY
jgi:transposase-like protein